MDPLHAVLRVLHIGAAVVWIGGGTLWGLVIMPTLQQLGPTLPKGAMPTIGGRVLKVIPHAGVATLVFGALTMWTLGGFSAPLATSTWAMLLNLGLLITLVMLVLVFALLVPTFKKMSAMMAAATGPPTPDFLALSKKMTTFSKVNLALGWLVVLLMVVAVAQRTT